MVLLPTAYVVRDGRLYFHFVCQSTPRRGGRVPWPGPAGGGGVPSQVPLGGVPHPALWGYLSQVEMEGGNPGQVQMGGGVPQPGRDGGVPG